MRIVAALAWYDEPVEFLERCVSSLAGFADVVVAVDGPWQGFPHDDTVSAPEQWEAVRQAAKAGNIPLRLESREAWETWEPREPGEMTGITGTELHYDPLTQRSWCRILGTVGTVGNDGNPGNPGNPGKAGNPGKGGKPWESQVAKRDHLMRAAGELGDWVLVIDGDEWLDGAGFDETRAALQATRSDVATVICRHHDDRAQAAPIRRLYRAGTRVPGPAHNAYRFGDQWLHGSPDYVTLQDPQATPLVLCHAHHSRGDARNARAAAYRADRRSRQSESWRMVERAATRAG